jgi:hypothetical protein
MRGSSPLSHFFVGYRSFVCWFITTIRTSVSNLLSLSDAVGMRGSSPLSLLIGYCTCVCWFITTNCTSVLSFLDAGGCEVRVLSLTSLLAIARVCAGSSPQFA